MRHKSPERIQSDIDKSIRKERRDRKRQERETRQKLRIEKQRIREHVAKNGVPGVKAEVEHYSVHAAVSYSPCNGCQSIVGNAEIVHEFCRDCEYGEEVIRDERVKQETQGDAPAADPLKIKTLSPLPGSPPAQLRLDLF